MAVSVRELLEHFKDGPKAQPLFAQLDELARRVDVARAQNVLATAHGLKAGLSSMRSSKHSHIIKSLSLGTRASHIRKRFSTRSADGSSKVEDAQLPVPPVDIRLPLPCPPNGNDWEALQAPVNAACTHFSSPAAKATWKQWALTPANVSVVVAVAWWIVAHVFQRDHPLAPAVKDHAFQFFSRRYSIDILTFGGAGKDLYHNLWQSVVSAAATGVLRHAYPRSLHKLDADLEEFVRGQLIRWTAGVLPGDLHPSDHELVGKGAPAAHTHFKNSGLTHPHTHTHTHSRIHTHTQPHSPNRRITVASVVSGAELAPSAQALLPARPPAAADAHRSSTAVTVLHRASHATTNTHVTHATHDYVADGMSHMCDHEGISYNEPHYESHTHDHDNKNEASSDPHGSLRKSADYRQSTKSIVWQTSIEHEMSEKGGSYQAHGGGHTGSAMRRLPVPSPFALQDVDVPETDSAQPSPGVGYRGTASSLPTVGEHDADAARTTKATTVLDGPSVCAEAQSVAQLQTGQQQEGGLAGEQGAGRHDELSCCASEAAPPCETNMCHDHDDTHHQHNTANSPRHRATSTITTSHTPTNRRSARSRTHPDPSTSHLNSNSNLDSNSPPVAGFDLEQSSPVVSHLFQSHALGLPRIQDAKHPGVMAHGFGAGQRARRRPLDENMPPLLMQQQHVQHAQQGRDAGSQSVGVGGPQGQGTGPVSTGTGEVFRYSTLAKQAVARADEVVAQYEASKKAARREVAAIRRGWLADRDALQSHVSDITSGSGAKDLSDKLSFWIENDVDRVLRDKPTASKHHAPQKDSDTQTAKRRTQAKGGMSRRNNNATDAVLEAGGGASVGAMTISTGAVAERGGRAPSYLSMTAAVVAGAGCASASFLAATAAGAAGASGPSTTRIMQPWSKMRSVEAQISNALSQSKWGSNDLASRIAVRDKEELRQYETPGLRGNGKRGKLWRPTPVDATRGTLDTRMRHEVLKAMRWVELEQYLS